MKRYFIFAFVLLFAITLFAQSVDPRPPRTTWRKELDYIKNGSMTLTYKTLTSPTITGAGFSGTTAYTGAITQTISSATTTGTERATTINFTQTGASASKILEALKVNIDANVQTGDWVNAVVARVDYGANGNANGGMVAPLCAELSLPPATQSGGIYQVADLEIEAPASYLNGGNIALPTTWLNFGLYGNSTAKASLEDYAYFFRTDGFTTGTGNMIHQNTMRVMLEGASWYLPLSDAEGEYSTAYLIDVSNTTDASSLTAASIATDGGLAVTKQIYLGDDLDMSVNTTGVYDITLKDGQADALSIVRGTTDMMVFDTSTPRITFTPVITFTGQTTHSAGINLGTSQSIVATTGLTIGSNAETVAINSSDWDIDATGIMTGIGTIGCGKVSSTGGVDLGTSQALTGTTAMTIGQGSETVAINSSDWDIDATGIMTGIGNITSDGLIAVTYSKTAAADVGTQRVIYGKYALTGSTPVTTASNNMVGARGEFNLGTGGVLSFNAGSSFASGVQGKIVSSGTSTIGATVSDQDARIQAVHGQMDLTGMTINGGQISIAEFDVQTRPAAINGVNQFNLLKITDASASKTAQANSIIYAYAEASYLMDLFGPENTADWISTGGTDCTESGATDPSYTLKISINGTPAYIRVFATP